MQVNSQKILGHKHTQLFVSVCSGYRV